ncbi:MAG: D-threo-aldose 1-dehydrogenase [Actinomycetota bacterium]|nr:D-threo-aldose 1-dehydrogenase [Actinomycetota bacterium]
MIAWREDGPDGFAPLGRGGLRVRPLSFGGAPLGNLGTAVSDEDAEAAVHAAWAAGIRYFDVAPHYGLGLAEERLGRALRNYPRDEYILSTKVGRVLFDPGEGSQTDTQGFAVRSSLRRVFDYSAAGVRRSLEDSLNRLGMDRVDIVFVHDPENFYRESLDGAFPALDTLRSEGVISSYGAGVNHSAILADIVRETDSDVVLAARTWTLADRSALTDLLPAALEREVSVVVAGVLSPGIVGVEHGRLDELCRDFGVSIMTAATRFPFLHPAVTTVLIGMRSAAEVETDTASFAETIPDAFWSAILDEFGLSEPGRTAP